VIADHRTIDYLTGRYRTGVSRRIVSQCGRTCHQSGNRQRQNGSTALSFGFCQL
jgi:hypothetical protein